MAYIYYEGHQRTLEYSDNKEDMIKLRKKHEKKAFGEFLRENQ
jgi:hypothetical protein